MSLLLNFLNVSGEAEMTLSTGIWWSGVAVFASRTSGLDFDSWGSRLSKCCQQLFDTVAFYSRKLCNPLGLSKFCTFLESRGYCSISHAYDLKNKKAKKKQSKSDIVLFLLIASKNFPL